MKVFAIGDLHISLAKPKEMDVFGAHWENHFERICEDWNARVGAQDVVLLPGDISWAMTLEEAKPDIYAICALPGRKIFLRGNHDYWWGSLGKVNSLLHEGAYALQNNCVLLDGIAFCGSRGWTLPQEGFSAQDQKIFDREKIRLELSLQAAQKRKFDRLIVLMHFPPLYADQLHTEMTEIIERYPVEQVVFGHLHGEICKYVNLSDLVVENITYNLVSADYLDFRLKEIL